MESRDAAGAERARKERRRRADILWTDEQPCVFRCLGLMVLVSLDDEKKLKVKVRE